MAKSMAEKVKELGFNPEEFAKDLFSIDDKIIKKCIIPFNYTKENIKKYIYPELKKFKEKYGLSPPISVMGVDMSILDRKLDDLLLEKKLKEQREKKNLKELV